MTRVACQLFVENIVFKNKEADGKLNISGEKIGILRKQLSLSQRALAEKLQLHGIDLGKNAIQQIESGQRFITDIELKAFAELFEVSSDYLLTSTK
jgi:transcriptional regulator with XRE-family HTH domain